MSIFDAIAQSAGASGASPTFLDLLMRALGQGAGGITGSPANGLNAYHPSLYFQPTPPASPLVPPQDAAPVPMPQPRPGASFNDRFNAINDAALSQPGYAGPAPSGPVPAADQLFNGNTALPAAPSAAPTPTAAPAAPSGAPTAAPAPLMSGPTGTPQPFDRLSAFLHNFSGNGGAGLASLADAIQGATTGARTDPRGMYLQAAQSTYDALLSSGVPPGISRAMSLNPQMMAAMAPMIRTAPIELGTEPMTGTKIWGYQNPFTQKITEATVTPAGGSSVPSSGVGAPSSGTAAPSAMQIAQTYITATRLGLTGPRLFDALPPSMQPLMRDVLAYKINPKDFGTRSQMSAGQIEALASRLDSSYDPASFDARHKAIEEFNTGGRNSPASQIQAGGTGLEHLGQLFALQKKLGGFSNAGYLNKPLNALNEFGMEMQNDPALSGYKALADKVVDELTTFYRITGGSEHDIERGIQRLTAAQSQPAREAAMQVLAKAVSGKVTAMQQRWKTALGDTMWKQMAGTQPTDFPMFSPETQNTLKTVTGAPQSAAPQPAAPAAVDAIAQAKDAIARGAPRDAVIQRLRQNGIEPAGL